MADEVYEMLREAVVDFSPETFQMKKVERLKVGVSDVVGRRVCEIGNVFESEHGVVRAYIRHREGLPHSHKIIPDD